MFRVHTPIMLSSSVWFSAPSFWMGARHHPHRKHDLRSGSQDHHPSKKSVQKTVCCNSTSNAPDDVPETCRAKKTSIKIPSCMKLAFHFISWRWCTVKQTPINLGVMETGCKDVSWTQLAWDRVYKETLVLTQSSLAVTLTECQLT
jgi:hypothetical protein